MIWNWIKTLFKHNIKIPAALEPLAKTVAKQIENEITVERVNTTFNKMMTDAQTQSVSKTTNKKKYRRKKSAASATPAKKIQK